MTTQQLNDQLQNIDNSVTTLADLGGSHELDLTQRTIEINTQARPNTVMHELNCVGVLNGHPVFIMNPPIDVESGIQITASE